MSATASRQNSACSLLYCPAESGRFGRSLGIDPISSQSTCSFNCVYCQLGKIEAMTRIADTVAAKLDAISSNQLQQVNHCVETINLPTVVVGIEQFRQEYLGHLAIQTMVLSPWTPETVMDYIQILERVLADEIQLNIPSRPRVLVRELDTRGNDILQSPPYLLTSFKTSNVPAPTFLLH